MEEKAREWWEDWETRFADIDIHAAAEDPCEVTKEHVQEFVYWMLFTRSASTAQNKFKVTKQFFGYLEDDDEIELSPFARLKLPKKGITLTPILTDEEAEAIITHCSGKDFVAVRNRAMIETFLDTALRCSELAHMQVSSVDLRLDRIKVTGKGAKERIVTFGDLAGRALSKYDRMRSKKPGANLEYFWLDETGTKPLTISGIKSLLRRLGEALGIEKLYPHMFRHTFCHNWLLHGGSETGLMTLCGWSTRTMVEHYARIAAQTRALAEHKRLGIRNLSGFRPETRPDLIAS
ncbi:Phage integrase [Actinokineospora spheciospongiae]|uniref:Phage integrase n=1 Tax=Actinokineospora spheciospongiae TaxID=909613 RepID=W7IEK5_9PSEU|nr:tyrosine-type recombinase/integrase [Actinokineospora spheciospongiae]EWC59290.1 Phage integrase [Actinokineospora spheciospongiae]